MFQITKYKNLTVMKSDLYVVVSPSVTLFSLFSITHN